MYCSQCGAQNKDTARFCKNCGEPLETETPVSPKSEEHPISKHTEKPAFHKKNIKWICIAVVILLIALIVAVSFLSKDKKEKKAYDQYLTSADKYLEDMDYEHAEDSYLKAISVDPKQEDPYLGLAELYAQQGDYKKADKILRKAEEVIYGEEGGSESTKDNDSEDDEQSKISQKRQELETKAAAQAYYDLLMDYQETYGSATKVTIDEYWKYLEGLAFAKLIDFDGDGHDELVVAYADPEKSNAYIARYSIEVWQYQDYELEKVYSGEGYGNDGGTTTLYITCVEDRYYLIEGAADSFEYDYFWGFKDGEFQQVHSLEIDYDSYPDLDAKIDGKQVTEAEFNEDLAKWWDACETYGLSRSEEDEDVSLAELQKTLDTLREILGIQDADDTETTDVEEDKMAQDLTAEEMATNITNYYNETLGADGTYVIFLEESVDSDSEYQATLRYQMSDEETQATLERGGTPSANSLVGLVTVNKNTGEVTTDWGDTWNMW